MRLHLLCFNPQIILWKWLVYCGGGGIRTPCVSYVPDLQSSAHPPSEQLPHTNFLKYVKDQFVLQIYRQYFNYPNILTKIICGPNENRTRVSSVTSWKDNHYPIRPIFSTPYRIRTCGPQLRRLLLYPTELREHCCFTVQIYKQKFNYQNILVYFFIFFFVPRGGFEPPTSWV